MSVSLWKNYDYKNTKSNQFVCDVVIIGGGISGLSSAYWLNKKDPNLKICVIEKYELGDGATSRNAGFITCGSVEHFNRMVEKLGKKSAEQIWKFSEKNLLLLKEEIIQDDEELMYECAGSFSLASSKKEWIELKQSASLMKSMNINVSTISRNDVEKELGAHEFIGGIHYEDDASINPIRLLYKIKELLADKNVSFYENHEVFSIDHIADEVEIKTSKGFFKAHMAVLATNAYSKLIDPYFEDKIYPTRGQILATSPVERFMKGPCYANFVLDYFRQLPTGELIIGGFRQLQKDVELGYSDETSDVIQGALEDFIYKHLPRLKHAKVTHRWSGIMGFSADGQPLIGALKDKPQVFFVGGFTAHGLGLAFHAGKCLSELIFDEGIPEFINARRFK